jgi:GntP family gluconate:H+ symporter
MIGKAPIALLITLLVCLFVFAKDYGMKELERLCSESLAPICGVKFGILVV